MTDRDEREREKENLKRIKPNKRMRSMRKGIDKDVNTRTP